MSQQPAMATVECSKCGYSRRMLPNKIAADGTVTAWCAGRCDADAVFRKIDCPICGGRGQTVSHGKANICQRCFGKG